MANPSNNHGWLLKHFAETVNNLRFEQETIAWINRDSLTLTIDVDFPGEQETCMSLSVSADC